MWLHLYKEQRFLHTLMHSNISGLIKSVFIMNAQLKQ